MNRIISFFSSDSRPLYKSDIYNAICLPIGYVIHFRYKRKYIADEIYNIITNVVNMEGVIFFAKSHEDESGKLFLETINISVRKVKIIEIQEDFGTELVHFYLQLQDFVDYEIIDKIQGVPPLYFVSYLDLHLGKQNKWHERVSAIEESYSNHLFINIQLFKKCDSLVKPFYTILGKEHVYELFPKYITEESHSAYMLEDETEYILYISFKSTVNSEKKRDNKFPVLIIEDKTKQIDINVGEFIDAGTNLDNRKIRIVTKSISNVNIDSFMSFKIGIFNHDTNKIESIIQTFFINSRISKKYFSIIIFALCTVIAFIGLALMTSNLKNSQFNYYVFVCSLLCVASSSSILFMLFNKK